MLEAALEPFAVSSRRYCSLENLADLGKLPNDNAVQVVVTRTFINVVPIVQEKHVVRQMSAPGKLGGAEPRESDTFSSASSTASGTHSFAPESDSAIASEDEFQRQELLKDDIDNLEERCSSLVDIFRETASSAFVRDLDVENSRKSRDDTRTCDTSTAASSRAGHIQLRKPNDTPKSNSSFSSKNPFTHLRQGCASSDEGSEDDVNAAANSPHALQKVQSHAARENTADISPGSASSNQTCPRSPSGSSSPSKHARRKSRLVAKTAAEAADAAVLEEACKLARVEELAMPHSHGPEGKKKSKKSKHSPGGTSTSTIESSSQLSASSKPTKVNNSEATSAARSTSSSAAAPTATKSLSGTVAKLSQSTCTKSKASKSLESEARNATLHLKPTPHGFPPASQVDIVFSDFDSKQRAEMKQTTLSVFRELKAIQPRPPMDTVGEMSYLQLAKFGPRSSRRLVSVWGDIFDVTSSPDKYRAGGELSWHTGKDVTWALITGSPKDVNGFYDIFKSGELLQRYLRLLCSWITYCEREYGKPVGRLVEWRDEQNLPPPPLIDTADCSIM